MKLRHYENEPRIFAFLGLPVHGITTEELFDDAADSINSKSFSYFCPVDTHLAWHALHKEEIRRLLFDIDRIYCESSPLWQLLKYAGALTPEFIPKLPFIHQILQHCQSSNTTVSFLGGSNSSNTHFLSSIRKLYPNLEIGCCLDKPSGSVFDWNHNNIIQNLNDHKTQVLLLATGPGTEQQWVKINQRNLPNTLVLSTNLNHFNPLTQSLNPLSCALKSIFGPFLPRYLNLLKDTIAWNFSFSSNKSSPISLRSNQELYLSHLYEKIQWSGSIDITRIDNLQVPINFNKNIILECDQVEFIDSSGLGLLIQLTRKAKANGHFLCLMRPSDSILRALRAMRLEKQIKSLWSPRELEEELKSHDECLVTVSQAENGSDYEIKPLLDLKPRTIERIEFEIERLLPNLQPNAKIVINLQYIFFMDSYCIGSIVNIKKELGKNDVPLSLTRVNTGPMNTLRMLKLDDILIEAATLDLIA